ncbi:hypothetical protein PND93_02735 [Faecalicoccus pleomorphus]|uniref:hypothetical protein n=1 Tax=Faecalicoccus pleomorphus TaxID=1323 RepID=UPI0023313060|nr:hypothetical protein [Faecalicoccus pleomorphus]MDB7990501.1 hypothetical protein [Faecalicoccus pleomorphus]
MPIPTIVQDIKKSLRQRKDSKRNIDESINLENLKDKELILTLNNTYLQDNSVRLLDEGAIMYEGGKRVRLYIMKGAIDKFYESLSDDYVGYVNLAHIDIWSLPLNIGTWTKQDLTVVDIGDGRKGLNVNADINENLNIVKDLRAQEIPLSISAELQLQIDWEKTFTLDFLCVSGIDIKGFSVVGNPANTNSTSIELNVKGEDEMNLKEFLSGKDKNVEKPVEETTQTLETEEKVELSSEQMTNLEKFMTEFESLKSENENLKNEINELKEKLEDKAKEAEKKSEFSTKSEEILSRLETLMSGVEVKKEEVKTGYLGSIEPKGEE